MVRIHDEGSEFDAPVEAIWKYLSSPDHGPAHHDRRHTTRTPVGENVIELAGEQLVRGQWVKVRVRNTILPPLGYASEFLEGPFAGSRQFVYYLPRGPKTGVTVVGEFVSPTLPEAELEATVREALDHAFEDDNRQLRAHR